MNLLQGIKTEIINPIIALLFALAVIYFLWGVIQYIRNSGDAQKRADGVKHITWGIVGLVIMVSVFGILNLAINTIFQVNTW